MDLPHLHREQYQAQHASMELDVMAMDREEKEQAVYVTGMGVENTVHGHWFKTLIVRELLSFIIYFVSESEFLYKIDIC